MHESRSWSVRAGPAGGDQWRCERGRPAREPAGAGKLVAGRRQPGAGEADCGKAAAVSRGGQLREGGSRSNGELAQLDGVAKVELQREAEAAAKHGRSPEDEGA